MSPDETTLYVTDGGPDRKRWLAFPVAADGSVGEARLLFDAADLPGLGGPDGLVVDQAGNIFAAGLERVFVFASDGTHLGSILPGSAAEWSGDRSQPVGRAPRELMLRISQTSVFETRSQNVDRADLLASLTTV